MQRITVKMLMQVKHFKIREMFARYFWGVGRRLLNSANIAEGMQVIAGVMHADCMRYFV